jgi:hypothetical protein
MKQRSALKSKLNNTLSSEGIHLKLKSLSSHKALEGSVTAFVSVDLGRGPRAGGTDPQPDSEFPQVARDDRRE